MRGLGCHIWQILMLRLFKFKDRLGGLAYSAKHSSSKPDDAQALAEADARAAQKPFARWTEVSARRRLERRIKEWRKKKWNFAASVLQHFIDRTGNNRDLSMHAAQLFSNNGWRQAFMAHLLKKASLKNGEYVSGTYVVGDANLERITSEQLKTENLWRSFPEGFSYRFYPIFDGELFYALAGTHCAYYGEITVDANDAANGRYAMSINLKVLLRDMLAFPDVGIRRRFPDYCAAMYLERCCGYDHNSFIYALWDEKGKWEACNIVPPFTHVKHGNLQAPRSSAWQLTDD